MSFFSFSLLCIFNKYFFTVAPMPPYYNPAMAIFVLYNFLCYCFLSHLLIHPSVSGSFTHELWSWSPLKFSPAPWLAYHLCPSVFKIPSTSIMQHNNDGGINIYLAEALKISEAEPMQVSSANLICSFCLSWVTVMQKRLNVQLKKLA